jgi:hypothetical protein
VKARLPGAYLNLGVRPQAELEAEIAARPQPLAKAEVGAVIAVQVADLASSHLECELTGLASIACGRHCVDVHDLCLTMGFRLDWP